MPTEMVSPANHFCLKFRSFHSSEGITPLDFLWKINSRLLPKAKHGCVFRDPLDAQLFGERVEENVAGLVDALINVDHTMRLVAARRSST